MYILGLGQIGGEDSSAALLKNGIVVGAVAEERISRIKHQGVSKTGVEWCLQEAGITMEQVDYIAIVDKPWLRLSKRLVNWARRKMVSYPGYSLYHIFHDEIPVFLEFYKFSSKLKTIKE